MNSERGTFMRRLLITLLCLAALSAPVFAQTDDHNDAGPLIVGYATVTATSGIIPFGFGGLTAFETFGYRSQVPALQAGVLPAILTTRIVLFASSNIRLSNNVGVAITNPGSGDAVVTMTLRRADGNVTSTKTITVAAHQQVSRFISEFFADVPAVPLDFDGTLTLTSNTPVAIVALRFRGTNFSTIPVTSLSPPIDFPQVTPGTGSPGNTAVLLPQFAADGRWSSETVVVNNGSVPLTVRIDLFKQDGTPLVTKLNRQSGSSFQNLTIAPGGIIAFSPRNANGDSDF
jgi:hypothetical protein